MAAAAGSTVLFVWGNNAYGKLGVGDISAEIKPTRLSHQFPSRCSHIAASGRSSAAIMDSGELYLWGDIYHGTKGTVHHTPQRVVFSPRTLVRAVSMGQAHVMALDAAGAPADDTPLLLRTALTANCAGRPSLHVGDGHGRPARAWGHG